MDPTRSLGLGKALGYIASHRITCELAVLSLTFADELTMCLVSQPAPPFGLRAVSALGLKPFEISLADYDGRWLLLLFYPRDFSFVCPTELTSFSARIADFQERNCQLLGLSSDSCESHREWLQTSPTQGGIGPLQFPLASDPQGEVASRYGAWQPEKQVALRGLFLIDPQGILQYGVVHNLSVGRNVSEILRVLDALQSGGLCPASWTSADGTIDLERALQPGRVLGHYRIQRLLGQGTFGNVFAVLDLRLDRVVAIKVLKKYSHSSRECILREARAAAALSHPNVCRILTVEEEDGLPLIVMEYLEGHPLSTMSVAAIPFERRDEIVRGLAQGLAAAHARQIVHGDLKPANIVVSDNFVPRILDFGLSRSLIASAESPPLPNPTPSGNLAQVPLDATVSFGPSASSVHESSPTPMGTPAYMSPEQWNGTSATTASDVFALGLIATELLTGRRALGSETIAQLLTRVQDPGFAMSLVQDIEPPRQHLLLAMLAATPAARPTASEVAAQWD